MAKKITAGQEIVLGMKQFAAHVRGEMELPSRAVRIPRRIDVKALRRKSGLSQAEFAARFGFNQRTLQDWEQGRRNPEGPARVLLTIILRAPAAVDDALRSVR